MKELSFPEKNILFYWYLSKSEKRVNMWRRRLSELFQKFYLNLANDLVKEFPVAAKKFGIESVEVYYINMSCINHIFIKDGADMLTIPVMQICNISIKLSHFPNDCKVGKLKPLHKESAGTNPKIFRPISLLLIVLKIKEKVMHDQTINYLAQNKIVYRYQFDRYLSFVFDR